MGEADKSYNQAIQQNAKNVQQDVQNVQQEDQEIRQLAFETLGEKTKQKSEESTSETNKKSRPTESETLACL